MSDWQDEEALLSRFREWMSTARAEASGLLEQDPSVDERGREEIGLWRLVEEFTALRHEVKLVVKSSRNLGEQNEQAVAALRGAMDAFQSVQPREREAARAAAKPMAEALADLDVALERGRKAIDQLLTRAENAKSELDRRLQDAFASLSWWRRRFCRTYHETSCELAAEAIDAGGKRLLSALAEGHSLIQNRLRRAMDQQQLQRIACEGKMVDPRFMTVIEVAAVSDLPPGMVLEEVRAGYLWQGQVLRFAEVRAVGGQSAVEHETIDDETIEDEDNDSSFSDNDELETESPDRSH